MPDRERLFVLFCSQAVTRSVAEHKVHFKDLGAQRRPLVAVLLLTRALTELALAWRRRAFVLAACFWGILHKRVLWDIRMNWVHL